LEMNSFLLVISFYKLTKHKICQVKFGKLLEMFYRLLFHQSPFSILSFSTITRGVVNLMV
jgi:hypothetical protein